MSHDLGTEVLSDIVVNTKYAKLLPVEGRRETWDELVDRNMAMHLVRFPQFKDELAEAYQFVRERKVLPSMRSLQLGGEPIIRRNTRIFNCAAAPLDSLESFDELFYLLLGGTGTGYSVRKRDINKLPKFQAPFMAGGTFVIEDSIEGWAYAVRALIKSWFGGPLYKFDYSQIRPEGAPISSGGTAPGPEPLKRAMMRIDQLFLDLHEQGYNRLTPIAAHHIMCHLADAVLSGGIRRSAMIAVFDADDEEMLASKRNYPIIDGVDKPHEPVVTVKVAGVYQQIAKVKVIEDMGTLEHGVPWYLVAPQLGRANNSVFINDDTLSRETYDRLFDAVVYALSHGSGDPGFFFSRHDESLPNPCGEANVYYSFCNLTEINVSELFDQQSLNEAARAGAILGTFQATYTRFEYLRPIWKERTEKEALLGVGLTGIANEHVESLDLREAAEVVKRTNIEWAAKLGINPAARATVVKPSGTASLVMRCWENGVHPRLVHAGTPFVRRMRVLWSEPVAQWFQKNAPDLIEPEAFDKDITAVISIPVNPAVGGYGKDEGALVFLNRVRRVYNDWILGGHSHGNSTHNVSATCNLQPSEYDEVREWLWENRATLRGISFLPYSDAKYPQLPYEEISHEEFTRLNDLLIAANFDITKLDAVYEEDRTLTAEAACAGGACSIF